MKRSGVPEAPARLLLKKAEVCLLLSVSGATMERMLEEGRLPSPIWLGATSNSRRWIFSAIQGHVTGLARAADRSMSHAHA
jgi:predicted DNA-binding transcriptional regulator AlpA